MPTISKKADEQIRLSKIKKLAIKEQLHNMRMIKLLEEHIEYLKNLDK